MTTTIDDYIRRTEHDAIARDIDRYLKSGGRIQVIPRGVSGMTDGLYGSIGNNIRKRTKAAKMYDDQPETEE